MPEVEMIKIRKAYWCFHRSLIKGNGLYGPESDPRMWLMRYLNNCPLPVMLGNGDGTWDCLTEAAVQKLEALQGPHGDTIAKAYIIRSMHEERD